jgi:hypothetical protein
VEEALTIIIPLRYAEELDDARLYIIPHFRKEVWLLDSDRLCDHINVAEIISQ